MRPRILVTLDTTLVERRGVSFPALQVQTTYQRAIEGAGGLPLFVAPTGDAATIEAMLELMDGLVVTGGAFDIEPERYGSAAKSGVRVDAPKPARTRFEWSLIEAALAREIPLLGICGGMQLLNVVLGGRLFHDIGAEVPGALEHEQPSSPAGPHHRIEILAGSRLHHVSGLVSAEVNSTHHQAVMMTGGDLLIDAKSPDGVVEAISLPGRPVLGVQWHPEALDDELSRAIYADLVATARARSRG